jgi:hypothetical protein
MEKQPKEKKEPRIKWRKLLKAVGDVLPLLVSLLLKRKKR